MKHRLSIVVPFRDRHHHLEKFIPFMEKFMMEEGLDFHIFIINQNDDKDFNRAKLLNVGFDQSKNFDYFAFHDVDMLPLDSDYSFPDGPTHLATEVEQFGYKLPYDGYFGGVTLFDKKSFERINGYANEYWGWGAEDDDILLRCRILGISTFRKLCRYRSLSHQRVINQEPYRLNLQKLGKFQANPNISEIQKDGLSTLHYKKVSENKLSENSSFISVNL